MPSVNSSIQIQSSTDSVFPHLELDVDGNTDEDGFRSTETEDMPDDNFNQIVSQFINIRKTFH